MFYAKGDLSIFSDLPLDAVLPAASKALEIPLFTLDETGRWEEAEEGWEGSEPYTSQFFGLEFMFCEVHPPAPGSKTTEYGISIFTEVEFPLGVDEKDINAAPYSAFLLNRDIRLRSTADLDEFGELVFYVSGDVTLLSDLSLGELLQAAAKALEIPPFKRDTTGKRKAGEVYTSKCFGLEFMLRQATSPGSEGKTIEYRLSIFTTVDFSSNGTKEKLDVTPYSTYLLNRDKRLRATADSMYKFDKLQNG